MVMFDSLNRHFLSPYGATWTRTPNFARLARQAQTYDRSYVASMPCMPARRDLHTGRPNFLHRYWGPLEPWDRSVFEDLREQRGVYSHLDTDHYHYFEDGGANYHNRYDSWQAFRGQEGDPCVGQVRDPVIPPNDNGKGRRPDWVNREHVRDDDEFPQTKTFKSGVDFLNRNHEEDDWILQIECFDPHEPFSCDPQWKDLFPDPDGDVPLYDWPNYGDAPRRELVERGRRAYAALLAKCDASLGKVLDAFDRHDLWQDTMLVVWTDHGILLGEHGHMMKNDMPLYEEISHTPLFVHDPRRPERAGTRSAKLVQPAVDLCPTLHNFFGGQCPDTVLGLDLCDENATRDAAIFGYFNKHVNLVTDQHAYYRGGTDQVETSAYTMMPWKMRGPHSIEVLQKTSQAEEAIAESQGVRPLAVPAGGTANMARESFLYDLKADPAQTSPVDDVALESTLATRMRELMVAADAPAAQLERVGLT
jgi:arylsulfatase A-like enzyme